MKKNLLMIIIVLVISIFLSGCSVNYIYDENYSEDSYQDELSYDAYILENNVQINVRDYPSTTTGNIVGRIEKGCKIYAYEKKTNDGYTWYRIGINEWVANNGKWMSIETTKVEYYYDSDTYLETIYTSNDLPIYSSPNQSNCIGTFSVGSMKYAYMKIRYENNEWYRIGQDEWVCNENGTTIVEGGRK